MAGRFCPPEYDMNELDIIILCFIAAGAITGLFRGFFKEIVGTIGVLVAAIVANIVSPYTIPTLGSWISNKALAAIFVWAVVFIAMMFLMNAIATLLSKMISAMQMGWINRLAGGAFGAIKFCLIAALLVSLVEIVVSYIDSQTISGYLNGSKCVPLLHEMVDIIMPWCSEHILKPAIELLKR